jgi:hypothetical protein
MRETRDKDNLRASLVERSRLDSTQLIEEDGCQNGQRGGE